MLEGVDTVQAPRDDILVTGCTVYGRTGCDVEESPEYYSRWDFSAKPKEVRKETT